MVHYIFLSMNIITGVLLAPVVQINGWIIESHIDLRKRMTMSTRFDLKFFRIFSKNRYPGTLLSTFHSSAKLALLSLLKEVKPSTNHKMK